MAAIFSIFIFGLFTILTQLCRISTAHAVPLDFIRASEGSRKERRISPELFESLEELARIVDISYCVGATGVHKPFQCLSHCNELKDFELITTWHTGPLLADSCGYIALSHPPSPKRIIVAFRGTYSIANAIIDLSAYPQEYISYPAGNGTGNDDGGVQPKCNDCYVHAGFMAAWQSTRSKVLEAISAARDQYPDYELELVGHSLGGAVAALAGTEMQLRGWDPRITTFGEPRVGNKAFVDYLDKLFRLDFDDMHVWGFRRVTHVNDPVPLVPLTEWGYEMHAGEIYISRVGLPFSVEDVMYCRGGHDEKCISGAETALSLLRPSHEAYPEGPTAQQVLSSSSPNKQDSVISESWAKSRLPWHLVPPRFRLWELFYSHRDYFLRLGLCVPGGDPSGKW